MAMLNNQMVIRKIGKKWALGNVFVFCNKKKVENNKDTNREKNADIRPGSKSACMREHFQASTFINYQK